MESNYPGYNGFRCVACNIAFNTFEDQKQHYFAFHSRIVNKTSKIAQSTYATYKAPKPKVQPINCDVCQIACSSTAVYEAHILGKKHLKSLEKKNIIEKGTQNANGSTPVLKVPDPTVIFSADVICKDCNVNCSNMDQMKLHLTGSKHQKSLKMKKFNELKMNKDPSVYCDKCDVYMLNDLMKLHLEGGKHKRKCSETSSNEPARKKSKPAGMVTTVQHCGYCLLDFNSPTMAVDHYQSRKHAIISGQNAKISQHWCEDCQSSFDTQAVLEIHLKGFKHYVKINRGNANPEGEMAAKLLKMREKMKALKTKKTEPKVEEVMESVPVEVATAAN